MMPHPARQNSPVAQDDSVSLREAVLEKLRRPVVAPATLYVVATPIGNLGDITLRALATLAQCSRVLCEDTRVTAKLLNHFGLNRPLVSCYEEREQSRIPQIIEWLKADEILALVSDAGTPAVSDPGAKIVAAVLAAGFVVEPVAGPSALTAALSVAGLVENDFSFRGFASRKTHEMTAILKTQRPEDPVLVFYESPHRLHATLAGLQAALPERRVLVLRELTKHFAQRWAGRLREFNPDLVPAKGELVLLFPPPEAEPPAALSPEEFAARAAALRAEGLKPRQIATRLAEASGISSSEIYQRLLQLKKP